MRQRGRDGNIYAGLKPGATLKVQRRVTIPRQGKRAKHEIVPPAALKTAALH